MRARDYSTDGHQMVYAGMGHEEVGCDTAGDLIVVVTGRFS